MGVEIVDMSKMTPENLRNIKLTWRELKDLIATLPEDILDKAVEIDTEDEGPLKHLNGMCKAQADIFADQYSENVGSMEELREWNKNDRDFREDSCELLVKEGMPFLLVY